MFLFLLFIIYVVGPAAVLRLLAVPPGGSTQNDDALNNRSLVPANLLDYDANKTFGFRHK